ncbi:hypothetical protein MKX03_007387 [Papaver bracteatum]|nr:hypothetical protein MKX03_007387 [Papaver bracteatum]
MQLSLIILNVEKLKRQIDVLRARERKADNTMKLMRRQRDRSNFKIKGLGGYVAAPPDVEKTVKESVNCNMKFIQTESKHYNRRRSYYIASLHIEKYSWK